MLPKASAIASPSSWPETVRLVARPKKSLLKSTAPSAVRGGSAASRVVTRNISPAPSQSDPVISGVCTYTKPRSRKNLWMAYAAALRTRKAAAKVLVRARRCGMVRRNSTLCRFFCSGYSGGQAWISSIESAFSSKGWRAAGVCTSLPRTTMLAPTPALAISL